MLQLLSHNQIDFTRYDACVAQSDFSLIYAESWYLDLVTKNDWKALVLDEYEAVMPLPYARLKRSFWKKQIVQPPFTQQLGVFGASVSPEMEQRFYQELKKLTPYVYTFHQGTQAEIQGMAQPNYVLDCRLDYKDLYQNFSSHTRRNVKKAQKENLIYEQSSDVEGFIQFYIQHNPSPWKQKAKQIIREVIRESIAKNRGELVRIKEGNEVLAQLFFLNSPKRVIYLASAVNDKGKQKRAVYFAFNEKIKELSGQEIILDFEGSRIEGIARFFQGFGTKNQPYFLIKK